MTDQDIAYQAALRHLSTPKARRRGEAWMEMQFRLRQWALEKEPKPEIIGVDWAEKGPGGYFGGGKKNSQRQRDRSLDDIRRILDE